MSRTARAPVDGDLSTGSSVGAEIRALRKAKGMTLAELAQGIGRSIGYVSQIERGQSEVGLNDLRLISGLFEVPIGWFFAHENVPEAERGRIVRAASRRTLGSRSDGQIEELLSPDLRGSFEMVLAHFDPGFELPVPSSRPTEEGGYVIAGELELILSGETFHLQTGDAFYIRQEPHSVRNPFAVRASVVWIIAPPVY